MWLKLREAPVLTCARPVGRGGNGSAADDGGDLLTIASLAGKELLIPEL